jgi:hypothetical protein
MEGLLLILFVVVIWVAAGELIQEIETADNVGPYFLSYLSAALFAVWLPADACWRRRPSCCARRATEQYELVAQADDLEPSRELNEDDARSRCPAMLRLGLLFGPLWFAANWSFNASLGLTCAAHPLIMTDDSGSPSTQILGLCSCADGLRN